MTDFTLDAKIPDGPIEEKWTTTSSTMKLVNPANKRKFDIIVVGTGLAGASAAATLGELGYNVQGLHVPRLAPPGPLHRRPGRHQRGQELPGRRRLRLPPLLRHREGRRLPLPRGQRLPAGRGVGQHHRPVRRPGRALRPGVRRPARQPLASAAPRSAAPSTPGARPASSSCSAPTRQLAHQIGLGTVTALQPHRDARRRRGRRPGAPASSSATCSPARSQLHSAHAVVLATGGYCNVFFLSTNAMACNVTAAWRAHRRGAPVRQPLLHADPPDVHPVQRRVPVEAHADVGVAAQRRPHLGAAKADDTRRPDQIPEDERDYFLERKYPSFGNLVPRDVASRNQDRGRRGQGRRPAQERRLPRLRRRHRAARPATPSRSATGTSSRCTSASPTRTRTSSPMRIYPAPHYTMGGLWVDYELRPPSPASTPPARPTSPTTAPTASAPRRSCRAWPTATSCCRTPSATTSPRCSAPSRCPPTTRRSRRPRQDGRRPLRRLPLHRRHPLGRLLPPGARQDHVGLLRHGAQPDRAWRRRCRRSPRCTTSSGRTCGSRATTSSLNQTLEKAGRVDDFFELAQLMCLRRPRPRGVLRRPLPRRAPDRRGRGRARRRALRPRRGLGVARRRRRAPRRCHKEPLEFENVHLAQRSYK